METACRAFAGHEGVAKTAENTAATGSETRRAPSHLQQLPEPATGFIKRRHLDAHCYISAQHSAELVCLRAGATRDPALAQDVGVDCSPQRRSSDLCPSVVLVDRVYSSREALSYIALNLPSANSFTAPRPEKRYKVQQFPFIFGCLIWLMVSACAFSVFLWKRELLPYEPLLWRSYARFGVAIIAIPWILFFAKVLWTAYRNKKRPPVFSLIIATVVIVSIQILVGYIASAVVNQVLPLFDKPGIGYSIFSTPLVLLLMAFEAVLLTGFTSRVSNDDDQEWWSRAGAWVLIAAAAWILVHSLVLYGPLLLLTLEETVVNLSGGLRNLKWSDWGKLAGTALGVIRASSHSSAASAPKLRPIRKRRKSQEQVDCCSRS